VRGKTFLNLGVLQNNSENGNSELVSLKLSSEKVLPQLKTGIEQYLNEPPAAVIRRDIVRIQEEEVLVDVLERSPMLRAVN
jgi:hypothetical protein